MTDLSKIYIHISSLLDKAQQNFLSKINEKLIMFYFSISKYFHESVKSHSLGNGFIDSITIYIVQEHPNLMGFNRHGLYHLIQFYKLYHQDELVTPLVTQIGTFRFGFRIYLNAIEQIASPKIEDFN